MEQEESERECVHGKKTRGKKTVEVTVANGGKKSSKEEAQAARDSGRADEGEDYGRGIREG